MGQAAAQATRAGGPAHIVLLLSANLILLAFFILLNALSEYQEDRKKVVLESVNRTFSDGAAHPQAATAEPAALGSLPHPRDLLLDIGSVLEAAIPAARSTLNAQATQLSIDFPEDAFFVGERTRLRAAGGSLLRRLAAALTEPPPAGLGFEVAFYHPAAQDGADRVRAVARATLVAERLQRRLSSETVSIGLEPRLDDAVRLVIDLREHPSSMPPEQNGDANE